MLTFGMVQWVVSKLSEGNVEDEKLTISERDVLFLFADRHFVVPFIRLAAYMSDKGYSIWFV